MIVCLHRLSVALEEVLACFVALTVKLALESGFEALGRQVRLGTAVSGALGRQVGPGTAVDAKIDRKSVPGTSRDTMWRPGASR